MGAVIKLSWNCAEQADYSDRFTEVKVELRLGTGSKVTLGESQQEVRLKQTLLDQGVNILRETKIWVQDKILRGSVILKLAPYLLLLINLQAAFKILLPLMIAIHELLIYNLINLCKFINLASIVEFIMDKILRQIMKDIKVSYLNLLMICSLKIKTEKTV